MRGLTRTTRCLAVTILLVLISSCLARPDAKASRHVAGHEAAEGEAKAEHGAKNTIHQGKQVRPSLDLELHVDTTKQAGEKMRQPEEGEPETDSGDEVFEVNEHYSYKYEDPIMAAIALFSGNSTDANERAHAAWELARRSLAELHRIEEILSESRTQAHIEADITSAVGDAKTELARGDKIQELTEQNQRGRHKDVDQPEAKE